MVGGGGEVEAAGAGEGVEDAFHCIHYPQSRMALNWVVPLA